MRLGRGMLFAFLAGLLAVAMDSSAALQPAEFADPPGSARPWVYAFWMEGSITKKGITADLEAMARAGIGGLLFMDGALGNPQGPHRFMSESWREMFRHMLAEADRLGLKVKINNAPGWAGSGGPWVKPEQASQKVIVSESILEGPRRFGATLEKPAGIAHGYYRDIAVLAYPVKLGDSEELYRLEDYDSTKSFAGGQDFAGVIPWPRFIPTSPTYPEVPGDRLVESANMVDLTGHMDSDGLLTWEVPAGRWLVLRIGQTVANGEVRSAQPEANGLESDKLSKSAAEAQYAAFAGRLAEDIGPLAGKTMVSIHIDSWEAGSGNWTAGFGEAFRRRRGYDLLPYMPTLSGIVVDSLEVSERFLWDYRETVTELLLENYAGHMRTLAHRDGMQLSIEAYDGTSDDLRYAGRADEPMGEFWQRPLYSGLPMCDLTEGMASAAHVYGRRIVGAEAFTARWGDFLDHPATLKPLADWALCTGVNRLYLTELVMQPWPRLVPGVSFRDLGTAFNTGLTWWEQSTAWHEYISRAQHMLQQGQYVADICFMTPEGAPWRFTPPIPATERGGIPRRPAYNFDGCPPEVVAEQMQVEGDRVSLPSGMKYRLLVLPTYDALGAPVMRLIDGKDNYYKPAPLPKVQTMTPQLLRRIKALLEAGATVLGTRPLASPSLAGYPQVDAEVTKLADEIWGRGAGTEGKGRRKVGKGLIVWGSAPEVVLAGLGLPADFSTSSTLQGKLNYTHRRLEGGTDTYFVVNQQAAPVQGDVFFRVTGRQPEWWWPRTGDVELAAVFEELDGVTRIPISLGPNESVFVVFRDPPGEHLVSVTPTDGRPRPDPVSVLEDAADSFIMAAWVQPGGVQPGEVIPMPVPTAGGWSYPDGAPQAPALGLQTWTSPGQGRGGFAVGTNGVVVFQYGPSGEVEPLLAYEAQLAVTYPAAPEKQEHGDPIMAAARAKRIHVGVIYKDRTPYLFIEGEFVAKGPRSRFPSRGAGAWSDRRPAAGELAALKWFEGKLRSSGHGHLIPSASSSDPPPAIDATHRLFWRSGTYMLEASDGERHRRVVRLPEPVEIEGPWQVKFDPGRGGPGQVSFGQLESWSERPEEGIRFYSGAAIYRKSFRTALDPGSPSRIFLDLGRVEIIAEVTLNGEDLGILWDTPHRVDVTDAIHPTGDNVLEVKTVNLLVNRMIGDEHLPEDSERTAERALAAWPKWVLDGKSNPTGRHTFATWRIWTQDDPLVISGLLGPVRLVAAERIEIP